MCIYIRKPLKNYTINNIISQSITPCIRVQCQNFTHIKSIAKRVIILQQSKRAARVRFNIFFQIRKLSGTVSHRLFTVDGSIRIKEQPQNRFWFVYVQQSIIHLLLLFAFKGRSYMAPTDRMKRLRIVLTVQ